MKRIVLAGHAVTADVLRRYLEHDQRYTLAGFTVDDAFLTSGENSTAPVVGVSRLLEVFPPGEFTILMAMGYANVNSDRRSMFERLKALGYSMETYVHPKAMICSDHPIGEGSIVLAGSLVEPGAKVGANTMIWGNVTLAHHSVIGDHVWVASGAVISGNAVIGDQSFIGVNATIVNSVAVGDTVIVGAGALITRDVKPSTVHLARSAEQHRFGARDYATHFGI
jgi:sugar O-acyltransferase (sialic acid O-acetyltransferase NeuD family)